MAEFVNQRIEGMINELEQMRRTDLFNDEEIREIARKRKEFEYKIQRRLKSKDEFVQYIAFEMALLEDISIRRKQQNLTEKKKDIEYAITRRIIKIFKQFISRYQDDIEVYFQYIKFCKSVRFNQAISTVIGQMLQVYGGNATMWQLASKWEKNELENLENAREYLLKGVLRHPESDVLYMDLFNIELSIGCKAESQEEKEKQIKRAMVVWKNGFKNVNDVTFLFKILDLCLKSDGSEAIVKEIKRVLWDNNNVKEVWSYIAAKELEGCHWDEIEDFVDEDRNYPSNLKYFIGTYEEALQKFSDPNLFIKYIHELLRLKENICTDVQKVSAVKNAWMFGHEHGLLTDDMYSFGIQMLKLENETPQEELIQILESAIKKNPTAVCLWEEKLILFKEDENKMLSLLENATKILKSDDTIYLWNVMLDNIKSSDILKKVYKKFQNCESYSIMAIKPKLLQKMFDCGGLKAAREMYEDCIRTPPILLDLQKVMINIEKVQDTPNIKQIRKCYEYLVQQHGATDVEVWMDYMRFETENGSAHLSPAIYRRAVQALKEELVDEFIKAQSLAKLN